MVVKINNKPVQVRSEEDKEGIDWVYLGVTVTGYSLLVYVLDYAAAIFVGIHPFPFIKFVGVILSWLGF